MQFFIFGQLVCGEKKIYWVSLQTCVLCPSDQSAHPKGVKVRFLKLHPTKSSFPFCL